MRHVLVVANGELPNVDLIAMRELLAGADHVIAADGGLLTCCGLGRWPDLLVGDFDSLPAQLVADAEERGVAVHRHPSDKDQTDLELALQAALERSPERLTVMAAFGGRLDHELATIGLLAAETFEGVEVHAVDGRRTMTIVRSSAQLRLEVGATVSLLPWGGVVHGVTTSGLRWPLTDATFEAGTTWGISNVAAEPEQSVSISDGVLLAVSDRLEQTSRR